MVEILENAGGFCETFASGSYAGAPDPITLEPVVFRAALYRSAGH
jgi:hypothetical protein